MRRIDHDALRRAIKMAREEDAGRRKQIDNKLRSEPWVDVARFAACCCQFRSLRLIAAIAEAEQAARPTS
jgi:hypothetical protein